MRKRAAPSSGPPFFIFKVFSLSNCKFQASRNFNASNLALTHRKLFDLIVQRLKYEEVASRGVMNSLLLLQSLGFQAPSANGLRGLQHGPAKIFRERSEISVMECHNRSGVTIAGRFQNHLIIRIR
jgi:hypothetical protein